MASTTDITFGASYEDEMVDYRMSDEEDEYSDSRSRGRGSSHLAVDNDRLHDVDFDGDINDDNRHTPSTKNGTESSTASTSSTSSPSLQPSPTTSSKQVNERKRSLRYEEEEGSLPTAEELQQQKQQQQQQQQQYPKKKIFKDTYESRGRQSLSTNVQRVTPPPQQTKQYVIKLATGDTMTVTPSTTTTKAVSSPGIVGTKNINKHMSGSPSFKGHQKVMPDQRMHMHGYQHAGVATPPYAASIMKQYQHASGVPHPPSMLHTPYSIPNRYPSFQQPKIVNNQLLIPSLHLQQHQQLHQHQHQMYLQQQQHQQHQQQQHQQQQPRHITLQQQTHNHHIYNKNRSNSLQHTQFKTNHYQKQQQSQKQPQQYQQQPQINNKPIELNEKDKSSEVIIKNYPSLDEVRDLFEKETGYRSFEVDDMNKEIHVAFQDVQSSTNFKRKNHRKLISSDHQLLIDFKLSI